MTDNNGGAIVVPTRRARNAAGYNAEVMAARAGSEFVDKPATVADLLDAIKAELARAMHGMPGMNADRIARVTLTAVRRAELMARKKGDVRYSLAACTPESFAGSLLVLAAEGLEPEVFGEAYLIPRKGEVTHVVGYQGYLKLFWEHPDAYYVDGGIVREHDEFEWRRGSDPYLYHRPPDPRKRIDRGEIVGYWSVMQHRGRPPRVLFLEPPEVQALRLGATGPTGDIPDPQHWMEIKTLLRQLAKLMPKRPQMALAVAADERSGADLLTEPSMIAALNDHKPYAEIEGPSVSGEQHHAEWANGTMTHEGEEPPEDEPETVERQKQLMTKDRRAALKALNEAQGGPQAGLAALRAVANDPTLSGDYATDEEIRTATTVDPADVAAWQQDNALAAEQADKPTSE